MNELSNAFKTIGRFHAKIAPLLHPQGCWLWTGAANRYGIYAPKTGVTELAHRLAFMLWKGPIPEGLEIDHRCGVSLCVNPDHLKAVTHWENVIRGNGWAGRNAAKTHCKRGHLLAGSNLDPRQMIRGRRVCLECRRQVVTHRRYG